MLLKKGTAHPCAVPECARLIGHGYLMCWTHWQLVPVEQQREVNCTWAVSKRTHGRSGYAASIRMAYLDARKRAIESACAAMGAPAGLPTLPAATNRPVTPANYREDATR